MEIIKTTLDDVTNLVENILSEQREACVYYVGDEAYAIVGSNGGSSIDAIRKHGIKLIEINHEGGTIIAGPGDVQIGIFTFGYSGHTYRDCIINDIIDKLKENGYDAILANNDLLVDDKKVIGFGSRMFGNVLYTALQISVDVNVDLIKALCTKTMIKTPGGLKNYGVTTEDVLNILYDVFSN